VQDPEQGGKTSVTAPAVKSLSPDPNMDGSMQRLMLLAVYGLQALARDFAKLQIMSQQAGPRCAES
jgi:hypothetical protein